MASLDLLPKPAKDDCVHCGAVVLTVAAMLLGWLVLYMTYHTGERSGYWDGRKDGREMQKEIGCSPQPNALKELGEKERKRWTRM